MREVKTVCTLLPDEMMCGNRYVNDTQTALISRYNFS